MANNCSYRDMQARSGAAACVGGAERTSSAGLLLWMLLRAGEAMAGEQPALPGTPPKQDFNAPGQPAPLPVSSVSLFALPSAYEPQGLPAAKDFSAREFRPRGRSLPDQDFRTGGSNDAPMLRATDIWQNLAEFRSRDSVRVVTLWQSTGSSISLQAGRKGTPTLQWTSRFMNRGGATRGILDQLLATSLGGFTHGLHFAPHAGSGAEPTGKSAKAVDADLAGAKPK